MSGIEQEQQKQEDRTQSIIASREKVIPLLQSTYVNKFDAQAIVEERSVAELAMLDRVNTYLNEYAATLYGEYNDKVGHPEELLLKYQRGKNKLQIQFTVGQPDDGIITVVSMIPQELEQDSPKKRRSFFRKSKETPDIGCKLVSFVKTRVDCLEACMKDFVYVSPDKRLFVNLPRTYYSAIGIGFNKQGQISEIAVNPEYHSIEYSKHENLPWTHYRIGPEGILVLNREVSYFAANEFHNGYRQNDYHIDGESKTFYRSPAIVDPKTQKPMNLEEEIQSIITSLPFHDYPSVNNTSTPSNQ